MFLLSKTLPRLHLTVIDSVLSEEQKITKIKEYFMKIQMKTKSFHFGLWLFSKTYPENC
jgi:hypothetical protein